ncbi:methyltransferase family protein [Butyrivibrio fibrisolvens]|uniref:methyltransferase family protein n=1 Tax=Butyrivibrio fibrisolvens TaxID=831 RepID=UPI0003B79D48|nr:isoprenylcysteine carboxylmethyltransferase family protein [Butyrivibrio fibrisolvens]
MLKNYMKEGQKLPLFGVGPYIVYGIAMVNVIGIILFGYVLKIGILYKPWILIFRVVGTLLIIMGIGVWYIGAVRSDMDDSITENRLQTNGIYSWVRNPMYSGWWIALSGITLMWHNAWLLLFPIVDWIIMTVALIKTEEKWLLDLYGEEYAEYKKNVNRCIPWKPGIGIYRTEISTTKWMIYDLPGNAGWIIWIVCTVKCLRQEANMYAVLSVIVAIFMMIGVLELISERAAGLNRILTATRLHRGFGALSLGGLTGIPVSIYGIISKTDQGLPLWMLAGAVLCALFAGLILITFKREK